jgi:hypothetical protein
MWRRQYSAMRTLPALVLLLAGSVGCGSDSRVSAVPTSPSPPGGAATAPPPATPSFAGVWQGEYRLTACQGVRHCVLFIGSARPFTLRLEQAGAAVAGVFTGDVVANVTGVVSASGELVLRGGAAAVSRFDSSVDMQRITLRLAEAGQLAGSLDYAVTWPADSPYLASTGPGSTRSGEITRAARGTGSVDDLSRFDGAWHGRFVVRECTPVGWRQCYSHEHAEVVSLQADLRQNGATVEGTVVIPPYTIPVRGTTEGSRLRIEGDLVSPVSGGRMVVRLSDWLATRDRVGRLEGRFAYDVAFVQDTGVTLSTRYTNELVGVVLSP